MTSTQFILRKLIHGLTLYVGVAFICFLLMVYFAPDSTYLLKGKNPSLEEIDRLRTMLGHDQPFATRFFSYLKDVVLFDFGFSFIQNCMVGEILLKTLPVSLLLNLPGFVAGNVLGLMAAFFAACNHHKLIDRCISTFSIFATSINFLIVAMLLQILLCSTYGLNLFPVHGWSSSSFSEYLKYVTAPSLCSTFATFGFNTRYFRGVFLEEMHKSHIVTIRAFGGPPRLICRHIFKNSLILIIARLFFSLPSLLISGSLILENFFAIPGTGRVIYEAIVTGDIPIIKAVVSLLSLLYIAVQILSDLAYRKIDPRISLRVEA